MHANITLKFRIVLQRLINDVSIQQQIIRLMRINSMDSNDHIHTRYFLRTTDQIMRANDDSIIYPN